MKSKSTLIVLFLSIVFVMSSCKEKQEHIAQDIKEVKKTDLVKDDFPESKQEVIKTFEEIAQSLVDGDIDKLISFHAYGPKFTEFKNGEPRNGGEANEVFERQVFGSVTEVIKFEANDLQVAVYGDVANATFHSDFHFKFGDDLVIVNDQISLLFVKTNDGWKIVHEHHSPLDKES